jgi:hypothetical protein
MTLLYKQATAMHQLKETGINRYFIHNNENFQKKYEAKLTEKIVHLSPAVIHAASFSLLTLN